MEGFRKYGAMGVITGMIFPWLVYGSIKMFSNEKDIAVLQKEEQNIIKTLERIETKVDSLHNYILRGE